MLLVLNIDVTKEGNSFKAYCSDLDVVSYGSTKKGSLKRIKAIIDFYIELAANQGDDVETYNVVEVLEKRDFVKSDSKTAMISLSGETYLS